MKIQVLIALEKSEDLLILGSHPIRQQLGNSFAFKTEHGVFCQQVLLLLPYVLPTSRTYIGAGKLQDSNSGLWDRFRIFKGPVCIGDFIGRMEANGQSLPDSTGENQGLRETQIMLLNDKHLWQKKRNFVPSPILPGFCEDWGQLKTTNVSHAVRNGFFTGLSQPPLFFYHATIM